MNWLTNNTYSSNYNMEYHCRICLENDKLKNLISPCRCSGNSKYVHNICINQWRNTNANNDKYSKCEVCNGKYNITPKYSIFWWLRFISLIGFIIIHICQILFCFLIYYNNRHKLILVWAFMVSSGIIGFYSNEVKPMLVKL